MFLLLNRLYSFSIVSRLGNGNWLLIFLFVSVFPMEVQQLLVVKEEVPSEWRPGMDQQVPEPIHMKQEQEELFTGQEGKQLNAQDDTDVSRFQFTAVTMKSEIEEEDPPSSQLHQSQTEDKVTEPPPSSSTTQIKTEIDEEDCGGSNPARNLGMSSHLLPNTNKKSSNSSEHENSYNDWQEKLSYSGPETKHNDGSEEMLGINSGINAVKYVDTAVGNIVGNTGKKCGKNSYKKVSYDAHMRIHTGEKSVLHMKRLIVDIFFQMSTFFLVSLEFLLVHTQTTVPEP